MSEKLDIKDFDTALENVKTAIKEGTETQIKDAIKELEEKSNDKVELQVKEAKEELLAELAKVQEHADKLDVKLQEKIKTEAKEAFLKSVIKDNIEVIGKASKSAPFEFEKKDMTLGNALTGDQPRDYNFDVVRRSHQMVNVEDLATSITITGGTYTYVRS